MTTFGFDDDGVKVPVIVPTFADDHKVNATEAELSEARHEGAERLLAWLESETRRDLATVPASRRRSVIGSRMAALVCRLRGGTAGELSRQLGISKQAARKLLRRSGCPK